MIKKNKRNEEELEDSQGSSTQYEDDSDTQYTSNEASEETNQDSTVEESDDDEAKKANEKSVKRKNLILYTVVGIALAGLAYKGYDMYFGSNNTNPQPQQQVTAPVAVQPPVEAPKPVEPPVPVAPPVQPEQQPVAPVTNENSAPVPTPAQTEGQIPNLGGGASVPVTPTAPINTAEQPPALNGNVGNPELNLGQNNPPPVNVNPVNPMVSQDAPKETIDSSTKDSIDKLIDRIDSMDDSFSKINETMDSVKEMVSTHDTKINSLDERVTKLEDAIKSHETKLADLQENKMDKVKAKPANVKPVVKKKSTVKKSTSSHRNSVSLVGDREDRVVRKSSSSHTTKSKASSGGSSYGYSIQAVLPGRAWVKNPNGTTSTYSTGDVLPNGNKVGKIDPDGGVFDSTGKKWPN